MWLAASLAFGMAPSGCGGHGVSFLEEVPPAAPDPSKASPSVSPWPSLEPTEGTFVLQSDGKLRFAKRVHPSPPTRQ